MQADGGGEHYREVIAALRREALPVAAPPPAAAAIETGGGLDNLHALASLAGGEGFKPPAATADVGSWSLAATTSESLSDVNGLGALTFDFDLPELDDWLNVLDDAPAWGGEDGSPSNWQLTW